MVKIGLQTIHHWGKHIVVGGVYGRTFWMPQGKQGLVDRSTICALQMATNDDCYEMSLIRSCCCFMTCNAQCVLRLLQVVLLRVMRSVFSVRDALICVLSQRWVVQFDSFHKCSGVSSCRLASYNNVHRKDILITKPTKTFSISY
jgi:hypothetical protein